MTGTQRTGSLGPGDDPTRYVGRFDRNSDGTITGFLEDQMGSRIAIHGVRDPDAGGYRLTGHLTVLGPGLEVPFVDDPE